MRRMRYSGHTTKVLSASSSGAASKKLASRAEPTPDARTSNDNSVNASTARSTATATSATATPKSSAVAAKRRETRPSALTRRNTKYAGSTDNKTTSGAESSF